eukprot:941922-Amphidinium_carterae.1
MVGLEMSSAAQAGHHLPTVHESRAVAWIIGRQPSEDSQVAPQRPPFWRCIGRPMGGMSAFPMNDVRISCREVPVSPLAQRTSPG